ncbi:histidine kinase dimerization/phosphoacceptor domain -containing protein [Sphingomonas sp.]|jgi:chemotaxis protein methyltransferase CheR|uniref:sensor histidine kinase n=1 Tax=Sphingomonas sp. TaxID=28214 RepID=UPI0017B9BBA9|nr:histidine kinase dimerization/phosphoacceptor domain -containing protein [Sphingomonas sp.]MBA3511268.1 PAS domain-containing protein [Sphingomonas sp.]
MKQFRDMAEAQALALAIVDTLPEPFLVLDESLQILAGSRCFYEVFGDDPNCAHGCSLFALSGGQWDIPGLRQLLAAVVADHTTVDDFEFERDLANVGKRTFHLNALPIRDEGVSGRMVLVAIKDITGRRVAEQEKQQLLEHTEELLEEQKTLLREMRHRIANSLQIIASILLLKAGAVTSEETKAELRAAHQRVMSVAAVQSYLHASEGIEEIEIGPYLTKLSSGLASSMIDPKQDIEITVTADSGVLPTSHAVSIGLIVTELIINAVKYAFPVRRSTARISVTFEMAKSDWKLTVADNGTGRRALTGAEASTGLGTALVTALAKQLQAQVSEISSAKGLAMAVTRATFESRLPRAA